MSDKEGKVESRHWESKHGKGLICLVYDFEARGYVCKYTRKLLIRQVDLYPE